ncbi:MAG: small multi-drug export protein [Candidatus Magasanikbacteria bacterium]
MLDTSIWFSGVSHEWATFLLSMLPLTELRASLPIALTVYKLPVWEAFILTVLGNMVPVAVLLLIIPKLHTWLLHQPLIGKLFKHRLEKAERVFSGKFSKYGAIALVIFVGIPLPMTGAWTGSLIAFIFNIPFRKSFPLIFAGVALAGIIVTLITLFAWEAFQWLW